MAYGLLLGTEGVLCSTTHFHRQAWEYILTEYRIPLNGIEQVDFASLGRDECLDALLDLAHIELSPAEKEILVDEKNEQYRQLLANLNPESLLPGVVNLLWQLKQAGWRLCIVTRSKNVILLLRQLQIDKMMDAICDGNDEFILEGHEIMYQRACKLIRVSPEDCFVWENFPERVLWAKKSGMRAVNGNAETVKKYLMQQIETMRS